MTSRMFLRTFYPNVKRCPMKISCILNRPYVECSKRKFTTTKLALNKNKVSVTFVFHNGERVTTSGSIGDTLLDVVVNNNVNLDGYGACEGTLTCSTCHVILKQEDYDRLPDQPVDEEKDMLDLAYSLTDTSRLGCQIILSKELDGLEVQVPETINDVRS